MIWLIPALYLAGMAIFMLVTVLITPGCEADDLIYVAPMALLWPPFAVIALLSLPAMIVIWTRRGRRRRA